MWLGPKSLGGLAGWPWNEVKALHLAWFSGLAILLNMVEAASVWPQELFDAYKALIPKVGGDSAPLGQRPLRALPVVYGLWASRWLTHLREWVEGWVPQSVFSLGNGVSSVEAWFSTALDIEEVLSGARDDHLVALGCSTGSGIFTSLFTHTVRWKRLASSACWISLHMELLAMGQTVQRAEFWDTILALQAFWPGHLGVDNLNVVRYMARLLDNGCLSKPLPVRTLFG